MSGWFEAQIVATGRLPLFCFFVTFLSGFGLVRLSARLIRAQVRWWPRNVMAGTVHVHHMVFGVVFMVIGGVAELAAPLHSLAWRTGPAALFGLGTALVLDEFALILHLRDVYWSNEGRLSIDAVFVAAGVTALLLLRAAQGRKPLAGVVLRLEQFSSRGVLGDRGDQSLKLIGPACRDRCRAAHQTEQFSRGAHGPPPDVR